MFTRFSAFYTPLIVTMAGGFLKEEGLDSTYSISTPEKSPQDALKEGSIHVGQSAVSASWGLLAKGELGSLVHFAQINERDGFFVAADVFEYSNLISTRYPYEKVIASPPI